MATNIRTPPLVIIGLDAGDPDLIQHWGAEGHLPTITTIMNQGCWGRTSGSELINEHAVWVSLFSGLSRGQHGYYSYRQLKPGTYDLEAVTGLDIDAPPFWSFLQERDKKVALIDVPDSAPIRGLAGVQLVNWGSHDSPEHYKLAAEPPELLQEVLQCFGPRLPVLEKHDSNAAKDQEIYRRLLHHVEKKGALCRHLLTRERFNLMVVVFAESHAASHQFWPYRPQAGGATRAAGDELTHATRDVYHAIDREVGLLLAQLPREANVFVVSSVGMEDDYPTMGLIENFCRQLGYQVPAEFSAGSSRPIDFARRIIPESWRIALSRHFSREKRERLLADQFRNGTNWRKTTAFAIPSPYTSFIRVNLQGREPEGIVEPGSAYTAVLDRFEADLKQLIDPQTNEPAVVRIARTVELFGCAPHPFLPDLFVEWKPNRFMARVVHPKTELRQRKPDWYRPSDHSSNGFVAAAGPSIQKRGALGEVEVLDLAPTFLRLTDLPLPEKLRGKPVATMLRD